VQSSATASFNWATLDRIYDYTQQNGILFKEHTFVWGSQQPGGTISLAHVENWIKTFCQRYPNVKADRRRQRAAAAHHSELHERAGSGRKRHLRLDHQGVQAGASVLPERHPHPQRLQQRRVHRSAESLRRYRESDQVRGAPVDAVGCQGHDFPDIATATMKTNIAYLNTQTGLPVYITEYDVSRADDTQQLNVYRDQFPFFLETSYIRGVTIWDGSTAAPGARRPTAGLVRGTSPRSAMTWLMQQLGRPVPP